MIPQRPSLFIIIVWPFSFTELLIQMCTIFTKLLIQKNQGKKDLPSWDLLFPYDFSHIFVLHPKLSVSVRIQAFVNHTRKTRRPVASHSAIAYCSGMSQENQLLAWEKGKGNPQEKKWSAFQNYYSCVRHHVQHLTYIILLYPLIILTLFIVLFNVTNAIIYPHFGVKETEMWQFGLSSQGDKAASEMTSGIHTLGSSPSPEHGMILVT